MKNTAKLYSIFYILNIIFITENNLYIILNYITKISKSSNKKMKSNKLLFEIEISNDFHKINVIKLIVYFCSNYLLYVFSRL